jgi:hypothetical protein
MRNCWCPIFIRLCWRHLEGLLVQRTLEPVFDGFIPLRNLRFLFLLLAGVFGALFFDVGEMLGASAADDDEDRYANCDESDQGDGDADARFSPRGELSSGEVF